MNRKKSLFNFLQQRIKNVLILTFAISSFAFVGSANAALLGLTLKSSPDISVFNISDASYDSNEFTATGDALWYVDEVGVNNFITDGSFSLTAKIDVNGMLTTTGSEFSIYENSSTSNDLLLSGMLKAVGFADAGNGKALLEFEYAATGGTLETVFALGGIIMSLDNSNGDSLFTTTFDNATGSADVKKIPEPLSVLLFGAGLLALGIRQRRGKTI